MDLPLSECIAGALAIIISFIHYTLASLLMV